uniref:BTB domain-containing protein n=1 Tax=Rhabditophanes sp. KR3021 TaxID=114890 RepID=A0AC35UD35_9BILA
MTEYYSSDSDSSSDDQFHSDLRVNTKDGFVMMPRNIDLLRYYPTLFSKLVCVDSFLGEVSCKELTVSEMNSFIKYKTLRTVFKVDCKNVFLMIKINKIVEDECLSDLINYYFYEDGLKPVGLFKYCREESLTDLCSCLKKNIQESFEVN